MGMWAASRCLTARAACRPLSPLAPSDAPHDGIAGFVDRPPPSEPHQECEHEQPANEDKQNSGEQPANEDEQASGADVTKQRNRNVHGSKCTRLQSVFASRRITTDGGMTTGGDISRGVKIIAPSIKAEG